MASSIFFNGRLLTTPQTASAIDDSAMLPSAPATGNSVVFIGLASAGQPNTVLTFGSPSDAAAVLQGGELLTAVSKAFAPSADTGGPGSVNAVRVGTSTPATLVLTDAGANTVITLTSSIYGIQANRLKAKVEAGSVSGLKLSLQYGTSLYSQDNVGQQAFSAVYTGSQTTATITVTPTTVTLAAPAGTTVATLALSTFQTVAQLVDAISAVSGFAGVILGGYGQGPTLYGLDSAAAASCKTTAATVTANLQAVENWFNSNAQPLVTGTSPTTAGAPPALTPWTYLSGGTDPATTITDWTNALTVLQTADVQWVCPLSSDPAVHAAVDAHVQYMSVVAAKERRAVVGPASGTSLTAAQALPLALDSNRTEMVWPGYYDYNTAGVLTLLPPYMTAALLAAMWAAVPPGEPLTNKSIAVRGLEVQVKNPVETDSSIQAGLTVVEARTAGYFVVRSISTWLVDNKYDKAEMSCGAAADYAARTLRESVDPGRGSANGPRSLARALSRAETALKWLATESPNGPGVLVGDANSPAWQGLTGTVIGDVIQLSVQISPVIPDNFITIGINLVPYTGSASA